MARYINPKNQSKEAFLAEHGTLVPSGRILTQDDIPKGFVLVCLVNNGPFTAAAISMGDQDLQAFQDLSDTRPRQLFFVSKDSLGDEAPDDREGIRRCAEKGELVY